MQITSLRLVALHLSFCINQHMLSNPHCVCAFATKLKLCVRKLGHLSLLVCLSVGRSGELIYRTGGVLLRIIMFAAAKNDPRTEESALCTKSTLCRGPTRRKKPSFASRFVMAHPNYKRARVVCSSHGNVAQVSPGRGQDDVLRERSHP